MKTTCSTIRRNVLLLSGLFFLAGAFAQSPGKLRLIVDPGTGFEFVLDRQYRMQQREVELAPGPHHFSFWAPTRKVTDTTVVVTPGEMKEFFIRLPYSPEFVKYNKEMSMWRGKRNLQRRVPIIATVGAGIWTVVRYSKLNKAKDVLDADREFYTNSAVPADLATLKNSTIPDHKDEFRKAQGAFYLAAGVTAACAGLSYYFMKRTGKAEKPVFNDPEKVKFEGLVWVPGPSGGQWCTQLSMAIGK